MHVQLCLCVLAYDDETMHFTCRWRCALCGA